MVKTKNSRSKEKEKMELIQTIYYLQYFNITELSKHFNLTRGTIRELLVNNLKLIKPLKKTGRIQWYQKTERNNALYKRAFEKSKIIELERWEQLRFYKDEEKVLSEITGKEFKICKEYKQKRSWLNGKEN